MGWRQQDTSHWGRACEGWALEHVSNGNGVFCALDPVTEVHSYSHWAEAAAEGIQLVRWSPQNLALRLHNTIKMSQVLLFFIRATQ
jgi:hypothetical protein